jgi:4-diphosphocytidyl-2-C-methyl-D-erythritol kinase
MTVREFGAAKVNLFLHVLGRRPDGYHDLDSLVVFAAVGDEIELAASHERVVSVEGRFADAVSNDASNIALRAVELLGDAVGRHDGVHIRIVKNVPVAAGLGGGSADAAAVLRGLARLWEIGPSMAFPAVAQALGADVPVCLRSQAARMTGIGDMVEALEPGDSLALVLVNCGAPLATADVFAACKTYGAGAADHDTDDLTAWVIEGRNDLEAAAIALVGGVGQTLDVLRGQQGCLVARMSGSGATCFGLFGSTAAAAAGAVAIAAAHPTWWVVATDAR